MSHDHHHAPSNAIDPVCGMTVDPANAAGSSQYGGQTIYFCSTHCKAKFDADPEAYMGGKPAATSTSVSAGFAAAAPQPGTMYVCPMDPEVRQDHPGACPKCGMALEPETITAPKTKTEWTCPMHPEIVRDAPGSCPICGMALEPRTIQLEEDNHELKDMNRRFWVSAVLTIPLVIFAMVRHLPDSHELLGHTISARASWIELVLATPVVLWGGWPFFQRAWASLVNRHLNMFTLIGLGVAVAFLYSLVATLAPGLFPASFRDDKIGRAHV